MGLRSLGEFCHIGCIAAELQIGFRLPDAGFIEVIIAQGSKGPNNKVLGFRIVVM